MTPFEIAAQQIGLNETGQKAALTEYLRNGGQNLDPEVTAWCAAFVNSSLGQAGMEGTGSNLARSFLDWGEEVQTPQRGDVAVFSRGDPNGWQGHVGFFDGYGDDGSIRVLGGNQSDAVSVASYSPDRLLGFRRAEGGNALSPAVPQQPQGNALAQQMNQRDRMNALAQFMPRSTPIDPTPFMKV